MGTFGAAKCNIASTLRRLIEETYIFHHA